MIKKIRNTVSKLRERQREGFPIEKHLPKGQEDVECKNCEKKVMDNLSFEKGVKDLSVDIIKQTVTVTYDTAKSDTTTLAKALRRLGYKAEVAEFK